MTEFFCPCIHDNLRIAGDASTGLRLLPCCVYKTDSVYKTLEEYESSPEIRNLRSATKWPAGCEICKKQEDAGQRSYRLDSIHTWSDPNDHRKRYEIFPSNVCNLKCLMCSPPYSTALAQERSSIGYKEAAQCVKEFDLTNESIDIMQNEKNFHSITLIGGEFFLSKNNGQLLDFVIEKNIPLRVVTNATVVLDDYLDKLKSVKDLSLQISIDGVKESYEFMRWPAKWDKFSKNVDRLIAGLPTAKLNFHYVVQPLNIQNLIPTLDYTNRKVIPTRITNLVTPLYLSWEILKPTEKNTVADLLNEQMKQRYGLTRQQREFIAELIETVLKSEYSFSQRNRFIDFFNKTMERRGIGIGRITEHLSVLDTLLKI